MKKLGLLVCALAAMILFAISASAKDMNGKFGVGYDSTLGGVSGLNVKYYIGDFALWGTLGLDIFAPKSGDNPIGFNFAAGGIFNFARAEQVNLGFGARIDLGYKNKTAMGKADSSFQVNIELPLIMEYFFTDHFSIHTGVGIVVVIVPEKGCTLTPSRSPMGITSAQPVQGWGIGIGNGGLLGNAGATFYF